MKEGRWKMDTRKGREERKDKLRGKKEEVRWKMDFITNSQSTQSFYLLISKVSTFNFQTSSILRFILHLKATF